MFVLCFNTMTLQVGFSYALFFIAVLSISLLYYNLFTIVDIDAFGAGLAAEADAVEGVPCLAVE